MPREGRSATGQITAGQSSLRTVPVAPSPSTISTVLPSSGKSWRAIFVAAEGGPGLEGHLPWFLPLADKPLRSGRSEGAVKWENRWWILAEGLKVTPAFNIYPTTAFCTQAINNWIDTTSESSANVNYGASCYLSFDVSTWLGDSEVIKTWSPIPDKRTSNFDLGYIILLF